MRSGGAVEQHTVLFSVLRPSSPLRIEKRESTYGTLSFLKVVTYSDTKCTPR